MGCIVDEITRMNVFASQIVAQGGVVWVRGIWDVDYRLLCLSVSPRYHDLSHCSEWFNQSCLIRPEPYIKRGTERLYSINTVPAPTFPRTTQTQAFPRSSILLRPRLLHPPLDCPPPLSNNLIHLSSSLPHRPLSRPPRLLRRLPSRQMTLCHMRHLLLPLPQQITNIPARLGQEIPPCAHRHRHRRQHAHREHTSSGNDTPGHRRHRDI